MGDSRFRAFISYSHADEAWGAWLQRALENYRAPKVLADKVAASGRSPRLAPVFRDREDLPVAGDLNTAIKTALAESEYQIVLCSPNAAASRWVNEEIKLFHKLHGPGRVFALIIGGEPGASRMAGREAEECFPPALRFQLDADGEVTERPAEPLAADAREDGDGRRYAMLKVAAGMLGVGLDDLVRRDAQKRARRLWAITGSSVAATMLTGALAMVAVQQSSEAKRMRGEAEGLIEFMLTDLNEKLEPVGRLDVLESVVDRAMTYYARQDEKKLDDGALGRRAKAMMQLGTIDYRRNNFNEAQKAYETAEAATAELLRRSPNDPDRIFDHAQNVFYVGEAAIRRYDRKKQEQQNNEYLRLAQRLVELEGDDPRSQLELAYATSNLGTVRFEAGLFKESLPYFEKSIAARSTLLAADPQNDNLRRAYAYAISWLARALMNEGEYAAAIEQLQKQLDVYGVLATLEHQDYSALGAVVTARRRLGIAHVFLGDVESARRHNDDAEMLADVLVERDPNNADWVINASHVQREKSFHQHLAGQSVDAEKSADRAVELIVSVLTDDAPHWYYAALGQSLAWRIELLGSRAPAGDAARLDKLVADAIKVDVKDNADFIAEASLALARDARRRGSVEAAGKMQDAAINALDPELDRISAAAKVQYAALCLDAGAVAKAAPIIAELEKRGVRHPQFLALTAEYAKLAAR